MSEKAVETKPIMISYVPSHFVTQQICGNVI